MTTSHPNAAELALIFETVSDPILLLALEPDDGLRIASGNPAVASFVRMSPAELVGLPLEELLGEPGREARFFQACLQVARSRRAMSFTESGDYHGRFVTFDVSLAPVVRDGRCTHVLSVARDISDEIEIVRALRESEQSLEATLRSITDAVVAIDTAGLVSRLNPGAEALTGWSAAAAVGTPVSEVVRLVDEKTRVSLAEAVEAAQRGAIELPPSTVLIPLKGAERLVTVTGAPIKDAMGFAEGVVLVLRDVTAQRSAEEEKRRGDEERAALSALIEGSRDFVGMATLDHRVLYLNPAGRALVGIGEEDDVSRMKVEDVIPFDKAAATAPTAAALLAAGGAYVGESWLKHTKTGEMIPVEVSSFVVKNPTTLEPLALGSVRRDIRERKRVEQKLRESEARYRVQFEHAPEAIVTLDSSGRFVEANENALKLFGHSREALFRLGLIDVSVPAQPDGRAASSATTEWVKRALLGESPVAEWVGRAIDGRAIPCEIRLVRLPGADNLCRASIVDISERKQAEELLRLSTSLLEQNRLIQAANRVKSEFVANMSHELRTPLNAILGFAELLHDGKIGPVTDEQRECLADVVASGRHLLSLINGMLDLAKVESGRMELAPERVDVGLLVAEVADVVRALASRKRIEVTTTVAPRVGEVFLDGSRLKQVLFNYLSNAIKFTPEEGKVEVRVTPDLAGEGDPRLRLEVEDSGIGIKEEDLPKLFLEFSQLDTGLAKHHEGTGLGLVLTKRIVEAMGGEVGVKSAWGAGSVFSAVVPCNVPCNQAAVEPRPRSAPPSGPRTAEAPRRTSGAAHG
jgi:PAS domain S-box-containing protein